MRRDHGYTLRVLLSVRDFLSRTTVTVPIGDLEAHRKQLDVHIARITQFTEERSSRARAAAVGTTSVKRMARRLRFAFIRPVVRAGQSLEGIDQAALRALTMPKHVTYEQLVASATDMAALVERHQEAFASAGFNAETTARMREAARGLMEGGSARAAEVARRSASVSGAAESVLSARRFVRVLDAMIEQALEDDAARLAEWKRVIKRVGSGGPGEGQGGGDGEEPGVIPVVKAA